MVVEKEPGRQHPGVLGFAPPLALTDQNGNRFQSDQLSGNPWIVNLLSIHAPKNSQRSAFLQTVQRQIAKGGELEGTRIVSLSIDSTNDTPEALKAHAGKWNADEDIWSFLTGSADEIRTATSRDVFKLATRIDQRSNGNAIPGGSRFALVDSYQRIRGVYDFENPRAINELVTDLAALKAEIIMIPSDVQAPEWMEARKRSQLESANSRSEPSTISLFPTRGRQVGSVLCTRSWTSPASGSRASTTITDSGVVVADVDGDERLDIYFVNQVGGNELWRNLGAGKFENITERAGVFVSDRVGVSAAFADIDNDGDPDLFVTALRKGNVLFENLGSGKFRNITAGSGLAYKGHSSRCSIL